MKFEIDKDCVGNLIIEADEHSILDGASMIEYCVSKLTNPEARELAAFVAAIPDDPEQYPPAFLAYKAEIVAALKARGIVHPAKPASPIVNWSAMPAWANWVAMDKNRNWWWYKTKLDILITFWGVELGHHIPPSYAPTFTGNWQDSLVERPKS